jgi:CMP-N-acetylneuraminic acid synthetase
VKILAIIPARGGSQRLRNKNIFPLWGKPMIYWAIKACKQSKFDIEVCISTENEEISKIAHELGSIVHKRDLKLADDKTYKQAVIRSAAKWYEESNGKQDIFISLQANSPEVKEKDLDKAIETLLEYKKDEIFSADSSLMQNAAFRIFKGDYVYQEDLSTNCGIYIRDLKDVHDINDIQFLEKKYE